MSPVAKTKNPDLHFPVEKDNYARVNLPVIEDFPAEPIKQNLVVTEINNKNWYQKIREPLSRLIQQSQEQLKQKVGDCRELVLEKYETWKNPLNILELTKENWEIAHLIKSNQLVFVTEFELRKKSIELGMDPNNNSTFKGVTDQEQGVIYIDKNLPKELQRASIRQELALLMAKSISSKGE